MRVATPRMLWVCASRVQSSVALSSVCCCCLEGLVICCFASLDRGAFAATRAMINAPKHAANASPCALARPRVDRRSQCALCCSSSSPARRVLDRERRMGPAHPSRRPTGRSQPSCRTSHVLASIISSRAPASSRCQRSSHKTVREATRSSEAASYPEELPRRSAVASEAALPYIS